MRKLDRGACPPQLTAEAAEELKEARTHFDDDGKVDGFKFKAYSRKPVKAALSTFSYSKCAYCEANYDVTEPVDVEHYRPKGAVSTPAGRKKPAYWWLAADWNNLLPSCIRCNRRENLPLYDGTQLTMGKGEEFPLFDEGKRASVVGLEVDEDPILINPCDDDPAQYIEFRDDHLGCIAAPVGADEASRDVVRARVSIQTYGLNRASLVLDRTDYLRWAKGALARISRKVERLNDLAPDDDHRRAELSEDIAENLEYLRTLCADRGRYIGMLRAVVDPALAELKLSR